jgi:predicted SnoaL-like aldol condensation-catalyzing enzyme
MFLLLVGMTVGAQDDTAAHQLLIERFYLEVYTNGDTSIIPDLVAESYVDHNQARWPTRDGIVHLVEFLHSRLPDLNVKVDRWYFKADHVVVQATFSGTLDRQLIRWATLDAYRIENGKLAEVWHLPLAEPGALSIPDPRSSEVSL